MVGVLSRGLSRRLRSRRVDRGAYGISGWETLCEQQQNSRYSIDGGFAEYAVTFAWYVVPVAAGVSSLDAAPLACAGVTTYTAAKVANIMPPHRVAVFGVGGPGHLAVQSPTSWAARSSRSNSTRPSWTWRSN
jgi:D-arabinose 1-dehydrogenase-like Zn-dependent alcohol dehydrogenase